MSTESTNRRLNDLLIELHRSLVQYTAEAWPWSQDENSDLQAAVLNIAERQRQDVGRLAKFLNNRRHRIDFGVYPHQYTSLHYVAIAYLQSQLIESQRSLTDLFESAVSLLDDDPEARELVAEIAASERQGLEKLAAVETPGGASATAWMK